MIKVSWEGIDFHLFHEHIKLIFGGTKWQICSFVSEYNDYLKEHLEGNKMVTPIPSQHTKYYPEPPEKNQKNITYWQCSIWAWYWWLVFAQERLGKWCKTIPGRNPGMVKSIAGWWTIPSTSFSWPAEIVRIGFGINKVRRATDLHQTGPDAFPVPYDHSPVLWPVLRGRYKRIMWFLRIRVS